jgi:hypothetical protein
MNVNNASSVAIDLYTLYRKSTHRRSTMVPNAALLEAIEALRRVPALVKALEDASELLKEQCPAVEWNEKEAAKIDALLKEVQS